MRTKAPATNPQFASKTYRYRLTLNSPWMTITGAELDRLALTLPEQVALHIDSPDRPRSFDRAASLLVALSIYCWGGIKGIRGTWVRDKAEEYDFLLTCHLLRKVRSFDRAKGRWETQVKYARVSTIRDLARAIHREKKQDSLLLELIKEPTSDAADC